MDFNDSPEEAAFRTEARAFLEANAQLMGDERPTMLNTKTSEDESLALAKAWQKKKAAAGFACLHWPEKYGGRGLAPMNTIVYQQEEAKYDVPRGFFEIGLGMCGPTMMAYATEEQKEQFLPSMISGEQIWSQLFSEPAAGSDLAGLRTRADRDGDDWIINGQKVWTSGAYYSEYGIIVTRHDWDARKHKGLTYFFLDLRSPGIEIKRIKQISGGSNFCEIFLNDVRIPDSQRLGGVGQGWQVALTTLMNERLAIGGAPPPDFNDLFKFVQGVELEDGPAIKNASVREKMADWYVQSEGLRLTRSRTLTALSRGETPGPEASIGKVVGAPNLQDISSFATELMEMGGAVMEEGITPVAGLFHQGFLYAPGLRIAGGTDEILRNIIAERVLGLPGEIRVDRDKPFKEIPTGSS